MNSSTTFCGVLLIIGTIAGQAIGTPLLSNGSASPATPALNSVSNSLSGASAGAGRFYSELQSVGTTEANMVGGLSAQSIELSGAYRFADNFTVPAPGWMLSGATFYAYQPGAVGPASPFAATNVRIWSGAPGSPGSSVVWGDALTNRMTEVSATSTYRIFNSVVGPFPAVPDSTRLIWRIETTFTKFLAAGTYWIDFQVEPSDSALQAFVPTVTIAGARTGAGFNALQFRSSTVNRFGAWEAIIDAGKPASAADQPQDLPFQLAGTVGCAADFNGDMVVDFFDYLDFVDAFSIGSPTADYNDDGIVDFFDYLDLVDAFAVGC